MSRVQSSLLMVGLGGEMEAGGLRPRNYVCLGMNFCL